MKRIDFHSHVLPRADHGSDCVETSVNQLALLQEAGVTQLVATPHFYPEECSVTTFIARRNQCADALRNALKDRTAMDVYLGAEVLVCPKMEEMADLEKLCIDGTNTMLLEMPLKRLSDRVYYTLEAMAQRKDLRIVLAHIDRYHEEDVRNVMLLPVLAQVNAKSLCGFFARRSLKPYFENKRVVALGSDLHMAQKADVKQYQKGLSKLGEEEEQRIYGYSRILLEGARCL